MIRAADARDRPTAAGSLGQLLHAEHRPQGAPGACATSRLGYVRDPRRLKFLALAQVGEGWEQEEQPVSWDTASSA